MFYSLASIKVFVTICSVFISFSNLRAQDTYADTLNCIDGTPTFVIDLSADADSLWISDPTERGGSCCSPPDNNCIQFSLTLSDDAVGILFSIPDGCGAAPSGSLFYQVDCGPPISVGEAICLDGPGPFVITFCKPGANENCYSIQSIAIPNASEDITITDACLDSLWVGGLDEPSIEWTSIFPGGIGEYDYLLDCLVGCDTVIVEAELGELYPELVRFQVCGMSFGSCSGTPFCDTVNVSIVPLLAVTIEPEEPTICYGGTGIDLTALPSGGAEPYTYLWNTGAATDGIYVTAPGIYFVEIMDVTGCSIAMDTVEVIEYLEPITADAGPDITICAIPAPSVPLNGVITGSTTGIWTGGLGSFSPDEITLDAIYTPTPEELLIGEVNLILTTTDNGSCPGDSDTIKLNFAVFSTEITAEVTDVDCFENATGTINVDAIGGAIPLAYTWDTGATSEDLLALLAGDYTLVMTDTNGCTATMDFIVTEPPVLTQTAITNAISCFGFTDGLVDVTPGGGTPDYDFLWDTGATSEDLSAVGAGTYSFTITDANGCTLPGTYTLAEPTELIVTATSTAVSCNDYTDGTIDVSVVGGVSGYSYLWDTGATTEDLSGLGEALYSLTVTDDNGCETTIEVVISEPDSLNLVAEVTHVTCFGGSTGAIEITTTGGVFDYTYSWDTGEITEDLTALTAGTYTLEVNDANGCIITGVYTLNQPSLLTVDLTGTNIACFGEATGITSSLVAGGTPGYTYLWNTGETTSSISDLIAGTYELTVTDENGCIVTSSIGLTQPSPLTTDIEGTDETCVGSFDGTADLEVAGGVPPYTFEWVIGDLTVTEEDLGGLTSGTYVVDIFDDNGCPASDSISLVSPIDFDAGPDSTFAVCSGDGIVSLNSFLMATTEGVWSEITESEHFNAETSVFDLTDLPAGVYIFNYIIPVFTPCTDTIAVFSVTVYPKPAVNFTADEVVGCAPLAISFTNLTIYEGSSCVWNMGDGTIIEDCGPINHSYDYPGDYDVTLEITSDMGCVNEFTAESFVHIYDNPEASFTYLPDYPSIQDSEVDFTNTSIDDISRIWNFGDGSPTVTTDNPSHTYPTIGNVNYDVLLIVTNVHGCVDTAIQNILIEDVLIFYVPNVFTPDGDDYNNVFKPVMTAGYDIYDYHLTIFNRWGEIIFESMNADFGWSGSYGSGGLVEDGVYIWTLNFTESSSTKKHAIQGHVTILK